MTQIKSPIEILKVLDSSNCGKCNRKTCLAFAGAVFKGEARLGECPKLAPEIISQYGGRESSHISADQLTDASTRELKHKVQSIDLSSAAERLGANCTNERLAFKCMGKDISVDAKGNIITEIHVNRWITPLVYNYILNSEGKPPSGQWVTFRELDGGENLYPLFEQRCEKPLKRVADSYTGLFKDMLEIFHGRQVDYHYSADISVMLRPLPVVPIMICYSGPEEDIESSLSLFFDSTIVDNLGLEGAFGLGTGLTLMFEKIASRHGR